MQIINTTKFGKFIPFYYGTINLSSHPNEEWFLMFMYTNKWFPFLDCPLIARLQVIGRHHQR